MSDSFEQGDLYYQLELATPKSTKVPVVSNWVYMGSEDPKYEGQHLFALLGLTLEKGWHASPAVQRFSTYDAAVQKMKTGEEFVKIIGDILNEPSMLEWRDAQIDSLNPATSDLVHSDECADDDSAQRSDRFGPGRMFYENSCLKLPGQPYFYHVQTYMCVGFSHYCPAGVAWKFSRVASRNGEMFPWGFTGVSVDDKNSENRLSWYDFCANVQKTYEGVLELRQRYPPDRL